MSRIGLSAYGTTVSMGLHPIGGRPLIGARGLMEYALGVGLEGVELPLHFVQGEDVAELGAFARERGLFVSLATGGYKPERLREAMTLAQQVGAKTVRTVVGGAKLGGDRRHMKGHWSEFLQEVLAGLREAAHMAEEVGINLAVENHQDLASEELLWLCESIASPCFGVTLDTGNPLATAEEPLEFARKIVPYLKNVHLKDYWIYRSEEGYRLVRCPLGQGAIDFAGLMRILAQVEGELPMVIELGALEARHVRVLADDYWDEYPARGARQLARVLRLVEAQARPVGEDWRTPFERNEPVEAIVAYEDQQLTSSLAYVRERQDIFGGKVG